MDNGEFSIVMPLTVGGKSNTQPLGARGVLFTVILTLVTDAAVNIEELFTVILTVVTSAAVKSYFTEY